MPREVDFLSEAGCWFLNSGIQEPSGGVARYYRTDTSQNAGVSNEITGYAVSALAYLNSVVPDLKYRDAAVRAAQFLIRDAWDRSLSAFPFEPASDLAYFFDTGIIIRGLLAIGDEASRECAREAALSLAFDFIGDGVFHPVIALPNKQPLPYESQWSRSPGCFQLKAALAWREIGDEHAARLYQAMLKYSLRTHRSFLDAERKGLDAETDREKVMDRLHAYAYFLEGLLPEAGRPEVRAALSEGLARASTLRREIAPQFERSDVPAQLLRVRLIAHHLDAVPLDEAAACEEADRAASFQAPPSHPDPRLRGGFFFGSKRGELLPFSNPVSTAFGLQALHLWREHQAGRWSFDLRQLI